MDIPIWNMPRNFFIMKVTKDIPRNIHNFSGIITRDIHSDFHDNISGVFLVISPGHPGALNLWGFFFWINNFLWEKTGKLSLFGIFFFLLHCRPSNIPLFTHSFSNWSENYFSRRISCDFQKRPQKEVLEMDLRWLMSHGDKTCASKGQWKKRNVKIWHTVSAMLCVATFRPTWPRSITIS